MTDKLSAAERAEIPAVKRAREIIANPSLSTPEARLLAGYVIKQAAALADLDAAKAEKTQLIKAYASLFAKHTAYVSEKIDAASADATLKQALEDSVRDYCDEQDRRIEAEAQVERLREALEDAKAAIESLPDDALGISEAPDYYTGDTDPYPIKDELLVKIIRALTPSPQSSGEEQYVCVNGHDLCDWMLPGPDCPYCEREASRETGGDNEGK
jgi:hypothetical protein